MAKGKGTHQGRKICTDSNEAIYSSEVSNKEGKNKGIKR